MDEKIHMVRTMESLSTLKGQSLGQLEDPKTFSPLRCDRQFMKDDLKV